MKKRQRELLTRLMSVCNNLGSQLDGTATNNIKYIDRQRCIMNISKVIYGVLMDDPENDFQEEDINDAISNLETLEDLNKRIYPDKSGLIEQYF